MLLFVSTFHCTKKEASAMNAVYLFIADHIICMYTLHRCKTKNLQNTLNIHSASVIQPWEDKYEEMATAMGIDPSVSW